MKRHSKRILLVNIFGTFGYMTCVFSWMWVGVLYLPGILSNDKVEQLLLPTPSEKAILPPITLSPSPATMVFAILVTIVVIILTLIVLLKAPITLARTSKSATTKAATSIVPIITRGKAVPEKERRTLTVRLIKCIKLLLVVLPVAIASLGFFIPLPLPLDIVLFVGSVLALIEVFWFSAQYITARLLKQKPEDLV